MKEPNLFDTDRMPARDDMGYAFHPDIDQFMSNDGKEPIEDDESAYIDVDKLRVAGFEDAYVAFDGDCEDEAILNAYFEEGDGPVGWVPHAPAGDGWLPVAIYDTENGPYAMFIRRVTDSAA